MNENDRGILEYEDELLAALEEARKTESDGLSDEPFTVTYPEARKIFSLSRLKTTAILNGMCDSGTLKRDMVGRINNWGIHNHVPGYRYVKVK